MAKPALQRTNFVQYLNDLLTPDRFRDYCPNGLQVEGKDSIQHVVAGVTASQALIDEAIRRNADAILVHHGWFWKGEEAPVTGLKKRRLQALLKHDINLLAYHLPLDAHPVYGNNTQLAQHLGLNITGVFGEQSIAIQGEFKPPITLAELEQRVTTKLERTALCIGEAHAQIKHFALCSGGGQSLFEEAIQQEPRPNAFLTGEISEQCTHIARESGVAFIAAGHHATERYGIQALAAHLTEHFCESYDFDCQFIDIDNPA